MMASAGCGPTRFLLNEIGPPPVPVLLCRSQPAGTLNEKRTPLSATATPAASAVSAPAPTAGAAGEPA